MTDELVLTGPTVTMFGDRDALDTALSDELGRRGSSTHVVTTPLGWLASVTNAVIRIDTVAGRRAIDDLMARDLPSLHVVAVCVTTDDEDASHQTDLLCRRCGDDHDTSVIWHEPFRLTAGGLDESKLRPSALATSIADVIDLQDRVGSVPSFSSTTFKP